MTPITLDIYFHGTFLLWFRETTVYAMAPMIHGHSYGLGTFGFEAMMDSGEYTLSVTSTSIGKTALPDPANSVVLYEGKASSPPDYESCYTWLRVPEPNQIQPYRLASPPFFIPSKTTIDHKIKPKNAPLVTRFRYLEVTAASLYPALWIFPGEGKDVQLHVYAEPAFMANPQHVGHGLRSLCALFAPPLDLTLAANASTVVSTNVPAEKSIAERIRDARPFSSISNCMHMSMVPGQPPQ